MSQKKQNELSTSDAEIPEEFAEVLEGVPEPKRKAIEKIMISQYSMISRFSPEVELSKKVTSEHITTMLNSQEKAMEYSYKENQHKMVFGGIILAVVLSAVFGFIALLKENPELLEKVLIGVFSLAAGLFGGYGIGTRKKKADD